MNRIIVALFRPGKRLPRSPGRHTAAAPAACSQPTPPSFPGGLLCAPPAASPTPTGMTRRAHVPSAFAGSLWPVPSPVLDAGGHPGQDQLLSPRVPWAPYSAEFLHHRSHISKSPPGQGKQGQWMGWAGHGEEMLWEELAAPRGELGGDWCLWPRCFGFSCPPAQHPRP